MKVLFLVPYPLGEAPSQRFRFEQYFDIMLKKQIHFEVSPFVDSRTWKVLYVNGKYIQKILGITKGFFRRIKDTFRSFQYDYVFIHREAAPLGPPLFEWIIAKVFSRRIIYDFDDAIWLPNVSESNKLFSRIKCYQKVGSICRWSHLISCGNDFLKEYALRFNDNVMVNPTIVDTENHYNRVKVHHNGKIVVGWTGTHSTILYLEEVIPVLKKLEDEENIEIIIISNARPDLPLKNMKYIPWKKSTEIEDLHSFYIGIMPLPNDEWAKGKCGFKLIQYLSLGIPAVSSPVGVNKQLVEDGMCGFLCNTHEEWLNSLRDLISNPEKRKLFGKNGRRRIITHFSVITNSPLFLRMFV